MPVKRERESESGIMLPKLFSTVEEEMKIHDDPRSLNNVNVTVHLENTGFFKSITN